MRIAIVGNGAADLQKTVYILGHATSGTHLLTNSIAALNRQALAIIQDLNSKL